MNDTFGYFDRSEFKELLDTTLPIEKFKRVLEIGSYEGLFTCYAASVFADVIHTVDPFDTSDKGTNMSGNVEDNFNNNVSVCPKKDKIVSHKMYSDDFFAQNEDTFDLIYVDGSHEPEDVYRDLNNSFDVCEIGGIIWVDDYSSDYKSLHRTIERWLQEHQESIQIIHKRYQVGFTKLK